MTSPKPEDGAASEHERIARSIARMSPVGEGYESTLTRQILAQLDAARALGRSESAASAHGLQDALRKAHADGVSEGRSEGKDADRVAWIAEALDLVESPGNHPIGAPGSIMRRAQEIGQRLARDRSESAAEVEAVYKAGQVAMRGQCGALVGNALAGNGLQKQILCLPIRSMPTPAAAKPGDER